MNIAFDAKRIFHNRTGLGNYSRDLLQALQTYYPDDNYHLFTPKSKYPIDFKSNAMIHFPESQFLTSLWRVYGITKDLSKKNMDIYHGLTNELPFGIQHSGIKTIVSIHDVIFEHFPKYYPLIDRKIYSLKFKYAAQIADKVIAISKKTKEDLVELYQIDPLKISVIYQNCHPLFKKIIPSEELQKIVEPYNLPEKFLLNVGTIEERKNVEVLIKALRKVPEIPLVIVGKRTAYFDTVTHLIKDFNLSNRVIFLENISIQVLVALYQLAQVFIYPSRYEGFGIPILEAMYSKTPVIAATGSCLEEVGGEAASYIDPDDDEGLARYINQYLSNKQILKERIELGYTRALGFNDETMSKEYHTVYHQLLKQ